MIAVEEPVGSAHCLQEQTDAATKKFASGDHAPEDAAWVGLPQGGLATCSLNAIIQDACEVMMKYYTTLN